jgi:hypothetical protein
VAENVARMLADAPSAKLDRLPTPLTAESRSAGQEKMRRRPRRVSAALLPKLPPTCERCGADLPNRKRRYCAGCLGELQQAQQAHFQESGLNVLAELKAEGHDPTHGGRAAERRGAAIAKRKRQAAEWDRANALPPDRELFKREILPQIQGLPLRRLAEATGLSLRYCSLIRRGERIPHPRHWLGLRSAARETSPSEDNGSM